MGKRVAHMVSGESLDYVPIDNDFVMIKSKVPESFHNKNLAELKIRTNYEVTVVAVTKGDGKYAPAFPETVLESGSNSCRWSGGAVEQVLPGYLGRT